MGAVTRSDLFGREVAVELRRDRKPMPMKKLWDGFALAKCLKGQGLVGGPILLYQAFPSARVRAIHDDRDSWNHFFFALDQNRRSRKSSGIERSLRGSLSLNLVQHVVQGPGVGANLGCLDEDVLRQDSGNRAE